MRGFFAGLFFVAGLISCFYAFYTTTQGEFILVDYSDKAIALFGDTKPIKDRLSDLGGRFNSRLTHNGQKRAGWIFQKAKEAQVRELIGMAE